MNSETNVPVKITVIGIGLIGLRHATTILNNPTALLFAVVDGDPAAPSKVAKLGCSHYTTIDSMLANQSGLPDAAVIATPNNTHVAIARQLLSAGINVLIEKPVSTSLSEGMQIIQAAKASTAKAMVGHHRRFNPYVSATKNAIESGLLGDITAVSGLWTLQKPLSYFAPPTEWRRDSTTGGPILINSIHDVDILSFLFGPVKEVFALEVPNRRGFDVVEGCAITLSFNSGAVGTFITADNTPSPYSFEAGTGENPTIPKTGKPFLQIFGTRASLSIPDMVRCSYDGQDSKSKGWTSVMDDDKLDVPNETALPFDLQLENLIEVSKGGSPRCSVEEGVRAVAVCEAINLSIKERRLVTVAELLTNVKDVKI